MGQGRVGDETREDGKFSSDVRAGKVVPWVRFLSFHPERSSDGQLRALGTANVSICMTHSVTQVLGDFDDLGELDVTP